MLKHYLEFIWILFAIFTALKILHVFQNIYFDLKKCSPYSRFSNWTGKIYFVFF